MNRVRFIDYRAARALGPLDHLVGLLAAAAVLAVGEHIATVASAGVATLLEHLGAGVTLGFAIFESHLSWLSFGIGLVLLGMAVAGADALVGGGRIRSWFVLAAVWAFATLSIAAWLAGGEAGWQVGAIIGAGLGTEIAAAFAAWWIAGKTVRRLRRGGGAVGRGDEAGQAR